MTIARLTCWLCFNASAVILQAQQPPDAVYLNATVITLDAEDRVVEALAVQGDRLIALGSSAELRKLASEKTTVHDLAGKVIVPGLYAAHDHFPASGRVGLFTVDLNSPPIGAIKSMPQLIAALKLKAEQTPKGQWVSGRGYDDTLLEEMRHPTREDLDQASTDHPIW